MTSYMGAAGIGLMVAAPVRPLQAADDRMFVASVQVQKSAYFGE